MVVVAVLVGVLLIVGGLVSWRSFRPLAVRRLVIVNLKSERALRGVLWSRMGRYLVLKDAELFEPERPGPVPMVGEVLVDRADVDFVQVLPDGVRKVTA